MSTVSNYALYCQQSAISKGITALQARADTTFNNMSLKFRKNMKKRKNSDYDLSSNPFPCSYHIARPSCVLHHPDTCGVPHLSLQLEGQALLP